MRRRKNVKGSFKQGKRESGPRDQEKGDAIPSFHKKEGGYIEKSSEEGGQ